MSGLPAACKPISSPRRGALVFLTLQELRLPHGQMGSDQPTCNHPMGFMATIHRIESGLWAQTGVRNQRNTGSQADFSWKGHLEVSGPATVSSGSCKATEGWLGPGPLSFSKSPKWRHHLPGAPAAALCCPCGGERVPHIHMGFPFLQ